MAQGTRRQELRDHTCTIKKNHIHVTMVTNSSPLVLLLSILLTLSISPFLHAFVFSSVSTLHLLRQQHGFYEAVDNAHQSSTFSLSSPFIINKSLNNHVHRATERSYSKLYSSNKERRSSSEYKIPSTPSSYIGSGNVGGNQRVTLTRYLSGIVQDQPEVREVFTFSILNI